MKLDMIFEKLIVFLLLLFLVLSRIVLRVVIGLFLGKGWVGLLNMFKMFGVMLLFCVCIILLEGFIVFGFVVDNNVMVFCCYFD